MPEDGPYFVEIRRIARAESSRKGYDALYTVASLSHIPSFYTWYLDLMALPAQGRLLDVSCGAGELVRLAGQRGLQAVGIDISRVVAKVASRNLGKYGSVTVGAGERLPFPDASFDFISNIGSLEHFVDPAEGVREMARVLRPGGKATVLLPNTFGLLTNVWNAFRKGVTTADDQPIQRYGARVDWVRLLEGNGLAVRRTFKYEQARPRTFADWRHYFAHPKHLLRLIAAPFVPLNLACCFVFSCERS